MKAMLKQVLHFGNPARLAVEFDQLTISREGKQTLTRPLEDIGAIVVDHAQVSLTGPLIVKASEKGVVIIWCGEKHLPITCALPLSNHKLANLRHRQQWEAGKVKFKQAWGKIIRSKLNNQATVLESLGKEASPLFHLAAKVKSGDPDNLEGRGAKIYWGTLFGEEIDFTRERFGDYPNNYLNYGYALIRAAMARSLVGAGLCVTLGIWHHNRNNPYALADDCMEPFRPWVDWAVYQIMKTEPGTELDTEAKTKLLRILHMDVHWKKKLSPMMVAMDKFCQGIAMFLAGEKEKFPVPCFPYG